MKFPVGTGNWQWPYDGWRLQLVKAWMLWLAPLACTVFGHAPAEYSALPEFRAYQHCGRCCRHGR